MPEPQDDAGAPQRHQELVVGCILLLLAERPCHGYELHERVKGLMPLWDVTTGYVYRELRRLDGEGLVVSVWETSQTRGPLRRVYEISDAGRAALDQWVLGVEGLVAMLEGCIALHQLSLRPAASRGRRRRRR